ncbi:protein phosphatase 2C domain-containing protein [Laspinema olomoucense]|uniref:protein phosphatase 2C domain-containing protein n=1 Tax=Laspinema olomoucense TaxID=3231600 RepID=UPI0021BAB92C|nr:protein phosphatase 2C domain-containing protein [Laspinema sp. D3c]MCT7995401.1 protein phosphatase 2C domain-containing protein [Laspinema sp. D3c]
MTYIGYNYHGSSNQYIPQLLRPEKGDNIADIRLIKNSFQARGIPMNKPSAIIYCPNFTCQSPNPETQKFCQKCGTPLPKRYLWAVGATGRPSYQPGDILADRYLVKEDKILVDTKPGVLPEMPVEIPGAIIPYLKLFPLRLHLPQVYGRLPSKGNDPNRDIWLLEETAIYPEGAIVSVNPGQPPEAVHAQLMPLLTDCWADASPMRQLNWLWQMAQLWHPFKKEGVAGSLLNPGLLRVEGSLLRLLELPRDPTTPDLSELGQLWLSWAKTAHPAIAPYLEQLSQMLRARDVQTPVQLIELLDRGLSVCGELYKRTYYIATGTDRGPTRRRNEDACYPPSGTSRATSDTSGLAIVCDGIGGHEGGNVASNLAIETLQQHLESLVSENTQSAPHRIIEQIEQAVGIANDRIASRNDEEQRQARQRMGTTLVMALTHRHEIYINHIGDSRAYWITSTGCRQVTLDDDVASREVRLGYSLYRDALQQGAAGSLIQALGMGASSVLHPTVQRFIIDEDSAFLLCSDGLSDNDRVEQYWETEILPVLSGEFPVLRSVTKLIDIGNFHNGHDNVTVGLVYCKIEPIRSAGLDSRLLVAQLQSVPPADPVEDSQPTSFPKKDPETLKPEDAPTELRPSLQPPRSKLPMLLGILLLVGVGVVAGLVLTQEGWQNQIENLPLSPEDYSNPPAPVGEPLPVPDITEKPTLEPGQYLQLRDSFTAQAPEDGKLVLLKQQGQAIPGNQLGFIPGGSVLLVMGKQQAVSDTDAWVQVQVCSTPKPVESEGAAPAPVSPAEGASKPGNEDASPPAAPPPVGVRPSNMGWISEKLLLPQVLPNVVPPDTEQRGCIDEPNPQSFEVR